MVQSVRPSVRLSVTPFWLCSHHRIIMKFSGVITNDKSDVHAKGQGQRSKVKVTEVTTQLNRFRTVTPVWIHIWWWNDAYSLTMLRRGALLVLKVICQISETETETETSLFNTTWHYTDAWYQTYMTVLMYYSVLNLISNTSLHVGRPLLRPCLVAYTEATLARQKYSATNEKCWHHFRILIVDKWSVVWNECKKNREFLMTGWKSPWSLATWLVISDWYIGEVIQQLSIEAMASYSNSTKPLPQLRIEYILLITSSSTTHYVCFLSDTVYN